VPETGYPARRINIPAGSVLSDDEIVKILTLANDRKASGDPGFSTLDVPEGYQVLVPVAAVLEKDEVVVALTRLNTAKTHGQADVTFTFSDGVLVKKGWMLLKDRRASTAPVVGGRPMPKEF